MNVTYRVRLTNDERAALQALLSKGKISAQKFKRAKILLAADDGKSDEEIADYADAGTATVYRTKRTFVLGNLEGALEPKRRVRAKQKLAGNEAALLVAIACSPPPEGRARWTLELLAGALVTATEHGELSRETIRRRLHELELKPWREQMWCIPAINAEFVARMEDVLDLYAEKADPRRPVICFDESPTQLIGEVRVPIAAQPGQLRRYDSEYQRNGTANLFIFLDAHRSWRHVKVTDRRAATDFAECMRDLVDVHYPEAEKIRVVMDNLSTHGLGALYERFPPEEARRILRKLEFHFVPKHASWLNMVEIEIGVLRSQCLDRRIESQDKLVAEIAAWEKQRNESGARIQWMFTTEKARLKMSGAYPKLEPPSTLDMPTSSTTDAAQAPASSEPAAPSEKNPEPDTAAKKSSRKASPRKTRKRTVPSAPSLLGATGRRTKKAAHKKPKRRASVQPIKSAVQRY